MSQQNQTVGIQPHLQQTIIHNTARLGDPAQGARRATSTPRTPRGQSVPRTPRAALRSRSPKPPALPKGPQPELGLQEQQALPPGPSEPLVPSQPLVLDGPQEQQALPPGPSEPPVPVPPTPLEIGLESAQYESADFAEIPGMEEPPEATATDQQDLLEPPVPQAPAAASNPNSSRGSPTTPVTSQADSSTGQPENLLPAKRPFDSLTTLGREPSPLRSRQHL